MKFHVTKTRSPVETATDRQERIKWWNQELLRQSKVMVIGAGALGNEVLKNLALLGVGYVLVVDFDDIELSNLSRTALFRRNDIGKRKALVAARRAQELNVESSAIIEAFDGDVVWDLGLGIYRRMDIVLGCLDNVEARLAANRACMLAGKPFIDGGIRELAGSVYVFAPPFECCFSCTTTGRERQAAGNRYDSCFQTMRRGYAQGRMANVQVTSALVAALQVENAIKWLHGHEEASGTRIQYDGGRNVPYFDVTRVHRRPGCECQHVVPPSEIRPIESDSSALRLRDFLEIASSLGIAEPVVKFPASFIPFVSCTRCGESTRIMQPLFRLATDQIECENCKIAGDRESLQLVPLADSADVLSFEPSELRGELLLLSLHALGFPKLPVVPVQDRHGRMHFFELQGDEEIVLSRFKSWSGRHNLKKELGNGRYYQFDIHQRQ